MISSRPGGPPLKRAQIAPRWLKRIGASGSTTTVANSVTGRRRFHTSSRPCPLSQRTRRSSKIWGGRLSSLADLAKACRCSIKLTRRTLNGFWVRSNGLHADANEAANPLSLRADRPPGRLMKTFLLQAIFFGPGLLVAGPGESDESVEVLVIDVECWPLPGATVGVCPSESVRRGFGPLSCLATATGLPTSSLGSR